MAKTRKNKILNPNVKDLCNRKSRENFRKMKISQMIYVLFQNIFIEIHLNYFCNIYCKAEITKACYASKLFILDFHFLP